MYAKQNDQFKILIQNILCNTSIFLVFQYNAFCSHELTNIYKWIQFLFSNMWSIKEIAHRRQLYFEEPVDRSS